VEDLMSEAVPQTPANGKPSPGFFGTLGAIFFDPREAFSGLIRRPTFLLPAALHLALALGFTAIWLQKADLGEFVKNQLIESGRWDNMPPEARAHIADSTGVVRVMSWVGAGVGAPLALLVTAGVLLFVFRFFYGGDLGFRQALSVVSWTFFAVGLVMTPMSVAIFFLKGDFAINPGEILQANPTLLLDRAEVAKPLWALVGSLDLFSFWIIGLLACGFGVASKKTTASALWGVVAAWLLLVALKVIPKFF
jgi:hypothetical protein